VKYVEFKQNNGGVKHPYSECVKNYEEKQKSHKLKLRHSSATRTKYDFGVLNHTGDNIIEKNSISCDNLIYSSHIAEIPSRTVSKVMNSKKMKILPKKTPRRILPKTSLSSIQQMVPPISWIDLIQKPTLSTAILLPLESVPLNKFHEGLNKSKMTNFSYIIHNYSERTAIAAEGMLMLSTPPSCSSGITIPEKETIDNINA
jgi:hypothetical protein